MTEVNDTAAAVPGRSTRRAGPKRGGPARLIRDLLIIFLAALVVSFLVKTFLFRSFFIPSGSMETTLQINDRIVVNELVPKAIPIARGDVVVFTDPGDWLGTANQPAAASGGSVSDGINWFLTQVGLGAQDSNDHLIKRVIGLPGDKVSCCTTAGRIEVNGQPIVEPYIDVPTGARAVPTDFDVTVPAGKLWVLGDNRDDSADSAYHFAHHLTPVFVPISDVVGRAIVVTWPAKHWAWLDNYPSVFARVEKP